jgi:thiamine phosphate synthase YjbQ (UPF0047 family)
MPCRRARGVHCGEESVCAGYIDAGQPMRETIQSATDRDRQLVDITGQAQDLARRRGMRDGIVHVCAQGATAAVMIRENRDEGV